MLKFSLIFVLLFSFVACDKGHNYTDKKTFVVTEKMKRDALKKSLADNRVETCEVEEEKLNFFKRVKKFIVNLFAKKKIDVFDITYPQILTDRVLNELEAHILEKMDFKPEDFWVAIGSETEQYINQYLIEKFVELKDEEFEKLRDFVAFSFLFYFAEEVKEDGYEIHLDNQELPISKINIAFTAAAKFEERKRISLCGKENIMSAKFQPDEEYLVPSDVTARVTCENRSDDRIRLDVIRNEEATLRIKTAKAESKIKFQMADLEVNTSNRRSKLSYSQNGVDLQLEIKVKDVDGQKTLSKKVHSLNARLVDGTEISIQKALKCDSVKPLKLNK